MTVIRRVAIRLSPLLVLLGATAGAQDLRYETATKAEFAGAMGTVMRMAARMGGGSTETLETTSIKGGKMRTDTERSSTIVDLDERRFITINHSAKTYQIMTFDEMAQMAQRMSAEARGGQAGRGDQAAANRDPNDPEVNFKFSIEDARQRDQVAGYDASRAYLTMEAEGQYTPEGSDTREVAGSLVVFTDLWSSRSTPALTARRTFDSTMAQAYGKAAASLAQGMAGAFASDPKLRAGMEKAAQEAAKIEGLPVRSTTHFVMVPAGKPFDRTAAMAPKPAQQNAAQQSLRGALSGLMGGRGRQAQQASATGDAPTQATFLTVTTEVRNITLESLAASLFEPPAGYRQVTR